MSSSFITAGGLWVAGSIDTPAADDDFRSPDVKTVFAHFGLAYYASEVLVHGLVNALVLARLARAREAAEKLVADPWDKLFRDTLGKLAERAGQRVTGNDALIADLVKAASRRNDLAHRFWRDHAEDFLSDPGRAKMLDELCEMRELFERVDSEFAAQITAPLLDRLGVTQEMIAFVTDEIRDRAGADPV